LEGGAWKTFPDIKYILEYESNCSSLVEYMYRCEELQGGGEKGEEEWQHGVTQAVQGGCRQLIIVVHVISASLNVA
jgi:hypothetical protein